MTDTNKLKELAELASKDTPGPWWIDSHGHHMVSESQDHRTIFLTNDGIGPATRHPETGNLSHWPNDWDASYIASADPTTILELIAEVERLRGQVEHLINQHMPREPIPDMPGWSRVIDTERLKAENEALRKDAERYRWLIASAWYVGPEPRGDTEAVSWHDHNDTMHGVTAAIDAALEGGGR